MPPRTARVIINHIQNGKIEIIKQLDEIKHDDQHHWFTYEDDIKAIDKFDVVINATGSKSHLSELDNDDQLILNLENRQVVQAHPLGGIQIIPETNQIISPRYGTLKNMFA